MSEQPIRITDDMLVSRRVDFERRMSRTPRVTLVLVAVLAVVFALEAAMEVLDSAEALLAVGALSREAVAAGEWWRLVTATLLHGGLEHLLGNLVALYILGMVCEHAFGRGQFVVLYAASAVAGSLLSTLVSPGPSVGASGAIFGLQGAAIVLFRRHRHRLLVRNRRIGIVMLVWAVSAIAGGLVTPYIDNGAHIGGAFAGALVARRLHPVVLSPLPPETAARVRVRVWLVAAVGIYAIGSLIMSLAGEH